MLGNSTTRVNALFLFPTVTSHHTISNAYK